MLKKILLATLLLTVSPSVTQAESVTHSPYTLHSISQSYLRTLERTCDEDKARKVAERQLATAARADIKSEQLQLFIDRGGDIIQHVAYYYAGKLEEIKAGCPKPAALW